jgi:hypothetical protein
MSRNMNMAGSGSAQDSVEMRAKAGAIRTAFFLLAFSLTLPILRYVWQICCQ